MLSLGTLRRRRRCVHAGSADTERIAGWLVSVFGLYSQCPLLPLCSMTVALAGGYQPGDTGARPRFHGCGPARATAPSWPAPTPPGWRGGTWE